MRNAHYAELQPDVQIVSNTASKSSAIRQYLRTQDSTTNYLTDGGAHKVAVKLKLVDAAGNAIQAVVDVFANVPGGPTLANNAFAASVGTLMSLNNGAPMPLTGSASFLTSSLGLLTATVECSAAATPTIVVRYGNEQIVQAITIA